jgi:23S rRNA pseudouridine2605 synthase
MERLQKVLAHAGIASRRRAEQIILEGRVQVNGVVVRQLGIKVNPAKDRITVDGKAINTEKKRTFLFYKPLGVITSMSDPKGRRTVADYFRDIPERVYPVGRLDYYTDGLLLMTNDGELAKRLSHPRYQIEKLYLATVKGIPSESDLDKLRAGIMLEDGPTAPAKVELLSSDPKREEAKVELIIHEGRNRQVRRMLERIGYPVKRLRRKQIGFLTLKGLQRGEYRELTDGELASLKKMVGM